MDINKKLMKLAVKASKKKEIPVSAIVINNGKIISKAYNRKNSSNNVFDHAEIIAIKRAARKMHNWNLSGCEMYVTLKPCSMCKTIINQSRVSKVYYFMDKPNYKKEYDGVDYIKLNDKDFNSSYQQLLSDFFKKMR